MRPDHVPEDYKLAQRGRVSFWVGDGLPPLVERLVCESLAEIERLLDHPLRRTLHFVIYDTNEEACWYLAREVPATMLMAPLHTTHLALVVLQSKEADSRNGDLQRMHRHIAHELGHVFNAERTGSTKLLGDGNVGMNLSPWVDEGLAENLAAHLTNQPERILKAKKLAAGQEFSTEELNQIFCNLQSPFRSEASAVATVLVANGIEKHGLKFVFDHLDTPQAWLS